MPVKTPFALFAQWLADAHASEPNDPNAMCLSTVSRDGRPSSRMVLLKGHDERGFVFYTNNHSRKGEQICTGAAVALLFHWKSLRKQIRIEGTVAPVSGAEADAYFTSRSRKSQLGAIASDQSSWLADRSIFEARLREQETHHEGGTPKRPEHWGGWRVVPEMMEFWADREFRLHERVVYRKASDNVWRIHQLYP